MNRARSLRRFLCKPLHKTATMFYEGLHIRMLLNFSFFLFQSPTSRKRFSIVLCSFSCFRFRLVILVRLYPPRQLSQTGRHCYKTNRNFFTLAAVAKRFSANRFQVILPRAITKIKKNALSLDQSQFSNFAPYIIKKEIPLRP